MQPEEERSTGRVSRFPGVAALVAALAFLYALVVTLVLLAVEGFFADYDNQRTVLIWLTLPVGATFLSWLAVTSPNHYLRLTVWFLVLAVLFFCWLTIFSVGRYYLPAPFLMVLSILGPWDGGGEES